jgi:FixJ family two-component response regulator
MQKRCDAETIAIVDDDESVREALESLLGSAGLQTCVFASAEDFLKSEGALNAGCLIVDVRMGGMNGLELQRRLISAGYRIPVIFITGDTSDNLRAQALQQGAIDFLTKPFTDDQLMKAIRLAFENVKRSTILLPSEIEPPIVQGRRT